MPVTFLAIWTSWAVALGMIPQHPTDTLRLYAVGDINLGRRVAKDRLLQGDTLYPFAMVLDTLRAAHILFGNLESPIAPPGHRVETAGTIFTAPAMAAQSLALAGFDIVSTANNHQWDGGRGGVEETMRQLTRAGVMFVGSGMGRSMAEHPVIVRRNGWRVAFFGVTRAWNASPNDFYGHDGADYVAWGDAHWIVPAVQRLRARGGADLIVVSVHAGTEYVDEPPAQLRRFFEQLVDAGVDVVLAHHPHVLQPVVWYKGKPIVQSLGNFIFFQDKPWTNLTAILRIDVAPPPGGTLRLTAIPVRAGFQAEFVDGAAADSVRRRLNLLRSRKGST